MSDDLTPQAAIRAFAFSPVPATPAPPTPAPAAPAPTPPVGSAIPPEPPALVPSHSHAGLSPSEATTMVGWIKEDLAKGKMTQAEADKAFDDLGTPADQRVTPPDLRSDEQKLVDQHFPVAKPEEFSIRYADPEQPAPPMTKELQQFDSNARTWLSQAEFPRDLGNSLITTISKVAQTTKHMDENQLEQYGFDEFAKLERVYGKELDAKLQAAGRMVEALDKQTPGLKTLLRSKGIGDSALVANMLIGQAERWRARRKGR